MTNNYIRYTCDICKKSIYVRKDPLMKENRGWYVKDDGDGSGHTLIPKWNMLNLANQI